MMPVQRTRSSAMCLRIDGGRLVCLNLVVHF